MSIGKDQQSMPLTPISQVKFSITPAFIFTLIPLIGFAVGGAFSMGKAFEQIKDTSKILLSLTNTVKQVQTQGFNTRIDVVQVLVLVPPV